MLLQVEFLTLFTSGLPSYYVPHSSWLSSLGNIVLLFSCSVLLFSILRLISDLKLWNSCYVPRLSCFLCSTTILLSFSFVDTYIPMDTYTNESCMIGPVHILTIVHPSSQTSSLLHLLRCTPEYLHDLCYSQIWDCYEIQEIGQKGTPYETNVRLWG